MAEPLTPAECDLQDFPFMPLHVARLRDSDLAATVDPEAAWYAVMLWASSWHQIPAASLPNDDQVLTRLCGLGRDVKTFRKNRGGAMRGFILCDDDRWYHPVVAEQANAAWKAKLEQRWRTECARIKKHNQRHETDVSAPSLEEFIASGCQPVPLTAPPKSPTCPQGHGGEVPRENTSKGQGQREGEGQGDSIIEVEEERAGAKPDSVEEIARLVGNAAGINHNPANDHQRYSDNLTHVREWIKLGATVEEMTECAARACAAQSEPIRTFRYLDPAIRQTVARRENPHGTRQSPVRSPSRSSASGRLLAAIAAEEAERPH
ncbi:YdaU family protein [Sphingobium sp. RSMS]|uniref:DUF1376 domain-containing protein n=1 Tax=Sphingobium sp. RSMS TaxID=520734 RepID=UPI0010F7ABBF|nr:DUF1376 domain-containing protein [Sphingobium sp. RSMS]UXC93114.1 YdaU family protein [Sphingobium sp. RSMS]